MIRRFSLIVLILVSFIFTNNFMYGKGFDLTQIKEDLPKLLGASNAGQDFWLTFNPCWETNTEKSYLKIYVSSRVATVVTVEIPGKGVVKQQTTIPNDIIEFDLTPDEGQCYRKTDMQKPMTDTVFNGYGIHVYADYPIICYGVTRYQYTSDGYLAIPVSSLGKEYTVASWADISTYSSQFLPSYTAIVTPYDGTDVNFTLGGNMTARTSGGMLPGEMKNYKMNKGDVLLISGAGSMTDLSGSLINSTKPVSVISSNFCAFVPENIGYCDFLTEMEIPSMAWGKEYHYTPIYQRKKNSIVKIFAKEPVTNIFRDGLQIATLQTGGGIEDAGWIRLRANEGSPKPIVFAGDKPIYIAQFNTGQEDDGVASDPFETVLTPVEQYQKEIIFNTPGIKNGMKFNDNYVNIVYQSPDGSIPDDLLFAKVVDGNFTWQKVSDLNFIKSTQRFTVPIEGMNYNVTTLLLPEDGVYKLKSDNPIAAYAYGFSPFDSYGFPASAIIADLNNNDYMPPDPKFTVYGNGSIDGGIVEDMPENSDRSNLSMIVFHPDMSNNFSFHSSPFIPGDDAYASWSADVQNKNEDAILVATFSDRRGNDTTIVVNYYSPHYSFLSDVDFGKLNPDELQLRETTVFNNSDNPDVFSDSLIFKNGNKGFHFAGPARLAFIPGGTASLTINFSAEQPGEYRDSVGFWRGGTEDEFFIEVRATVVNPTSVDDDFTNYINVYPNPINDLLCIKINNDAQKALSLKILDDYGNIVYENTNINEPNLKINTSSFPSGIYFLQIRSGSGIVNRKIVVVH